MRPLQPCVERLLDRIEARGWKGRIVPIRHLPELKEAIRGRYRNLSMLIGRASTSDA